MSNEDIFPMVAMRAADACHCNVLCVSFTAQ
jgi:hypothetical protein